MTWHYTYIAMFFCLPAFLGRPHTKDQLT